MQNRKRKGPVEFQVIEAAIAGDAAAINKVIDYFQPYICFPIYSAGYKYLLVKVQLFFLKARTVSGISTYQSSWQRMISDIKAGRFLNW